MTKKSLLLLAGISGFTAVTAQNTFTGIELQPTVAYLKKNGKEARMVRLLFHGGNSYAKATVRMEFNSRLDSVLVPASEKGISLYELPLPGDAVGRETQLSVQVVSAGREYNARCMVAPTQKWKVYLLPHSHVDIGYTNVQAKVMKIHLDNIDEAIKIAKKTEQYPEGARFKWNTEAFWVVDHYLAGADEAKKKAFWEAVKKGWINIDGAYANINTSITDSRQLMQMFHTAVKTAKEHGVEIHTMFQGDVPGASWGLSSQADITGIKYFWGAPNAGDRIGNSFKWRDRPFYWQSPGGQKLLYWQSSPYSIGYSLKGNKIPNFFTVEDPLPFYTGKPSENFLNPFLFNYLAELDQKLFPYNMTILTWAMSDNAPIDPELPDAVKEWNERYASPQLVITSVKDFFHDFEAAYGAKVPVVSGDYTEYWTDGIASAARETGINRNNSDRLLQAEAIWALRNKKAFPARDFDTAWNNVLMFNEHTWGAHNSVSHPEDPKAIAQWSYKQAFALTAQAQSKELLAKAAADASAASGVDVYNTLGQQRTDVVLIPAAQSSAGDLVKDAGGRSVPSQRLSTGELAVLVKQIPAFSKQRFTIHNGKAYVGERASVSTTTLQNKFYTIKLDEKTGHIISLEKAGRNLADSGGLNQYTYLPDAAKEKIQFAGPAKITIKEKGPLVVSLEAVSDAPGAHSLKREVRLTAGVDRVEIINTLDKKAVPAKEGVHFAFPFKVPGAQVRYSIPWGSVAAEEDQLQHANRNWYSVQRWVDVSNKDFGVTWSSLDAPLFEIGTQTSAGLLGGLTRSPKWINYMEQNPAIYSWVMNNLWHTNFRRDQEGVTVFRYALQVHDAYDVAAANQQGFSNHRSLVATPAAGPATESLFFSIDSKAVYVESIKPAAGGKGVVVQLVNTQEQPAVVTLKGKINVWQSNMLEEYKNKLEDRVELPGKGVIMVRVETK
ncbi:glycoside hydrolase family 38 C-terminal domain-containing protein [Chitinophaga niabensis]|uniref:glycoside hydrolase family 38 N-terminal domain-containing protein n=1 Tax=Chitinophaga niabensis TaxID=536979 RepID=UPI0031BB0583